MKEYIERAAVLDVVKRTSGDYAAAWSEIAHMPAAEVAPVRHGRWEEVRDAYGNLEGWLCECGREVKSKDNYCPNCGALMDKEDENEAD